MLLHFTIYMYSGIIKAAQPFETGPVIISLFLFLALSQVPFTNMGGIIPLIMQQSRERCLIHPERMVVPYDLGRSILMGILSGEEIGPGRRTDTTYGKGIFKIAPFSRQAIQVRCFYIGISIGTQHVGPLVVGHNKDNIGTLSRFDRGSLTASV
jgi:hypothetical protein